LRNIGLVLVSLIVGGASWLLAAWAVSLIADQTRSAAAETLLAAMAPVTFGPLFAAAVTVLCFVVLKRHAQPK
jgi:hypothetical protein